MSNEITPPKLTDPFDKAIEEVAKGVNKGVKYAKVALISIVLLSLSLTGLLVWAATHFILKVW